MPLTEITDTIFPGFSGDDVVLMVSNWKNIKPAVGGRGGGGGGIIGPIYCHCKYD